MISQWTPVAFIFFITILPVIAEESCPGPVLKLKNYADLIEEQATVIAECRRTVEALINNMTWQWGNLFSIKADILSQNKNNNQGEYKSHFFWKKMSEFWVSWVSFGDKESSKWQRGVSGKCMRLNVETILSSSPYSFGQWYACTHQQVLGEIKNISQNPRLVFICSWCCFPGGIDIWWHPAERGYSQVQWDSSEWCKRVSWFKISWTDLSCWSLTAWTLAHSETCLLLLF